MTPVYLNTKSMAEVIGKHPNFLKQRKGTQFKLDEHYFEPNGNKDPFWKVEAITLWVEGNEQSTNDIANNVLEKIGA